MSPVPSYVNDAWRKASRTRAEWLYAISAGLVTPTEAIMAAATIDGSPLMNMSLRVLLSAACPRQVADGIVVALGRAFGCDLARVYVPVRWLYDGRSLRDERIAALEVALLARAVPLDVQA